MNEKIKKPQNLLDSINAEYDRLTENELTNLGVVLGAYRSFRGDRRSHIAYVGMPITTGKRYYDVLSEHGVKSREELTEKVGQKALWEEVIQPNINEGISFADSLGKQRDMLFIAPSVFEAKQWRWTDDAYMSLWYRVLGEMAGTHWVMDGWEYSTGGLREVMFSMIMQWGVIRSFNKDTAVKAFGLKNFHSGLTKEEESLEFMEMRKMRVYDSAGIDIRIDGALSKSVDAIYDLKQRNFPYQDLLGPANSIMQTPFMSPYLMADEKYSPVGFGTQKYREAKDRLKNLKY
ncbi:hypothetical protein HYW46_07075 [Candidatus Daviesbacteria bacterium]|nr:hypothetical protein [Candidatus Daviesbacteria bacterium]